MNAIELAFLRVARQCEEEMKQRPFTPEEQSRAERILRWAKQVLESTRQQERQTL